MHRMKTKTSINHKHIVFLTVTALLIMTSCRPHEVIRVVVTPTPNPEAALVASATPTTTDTETSTVTPEPTHTPTETSTPTQTTTAATSAGPTDIPDFGPIVGPDYVRPTLPPVDTPTPEPDAATATPRVTLDPRSPTIVTTPVPRLNPNEMGLQLDVNLSFEDFEQAVGDAQTTGVKWIKLQVNWDFLQFEGPNDVEKIALFERQVELASRPEGMRVLLSFAKAPRWTRSVLQEDGPPDDPQELADFITMLLRDTKVGSAIDAIEIWNEPNLQREWQGTLPFNGAGYMRLFEPSYRAIRAIYPDMTIVTAGLAPTSNLPGAVDDREFLQQMYDAGLRNYVNDANLEIGVHPYGWANDPDARCCGAANAEPGWDDNPRFFFLENIEAVRSIMVRNDHENAQIWVTEFGWPSWHGIGAPAPEAWLTYLTPNQQADYIIRAFEYAQRTDYIGPMFLWNLNFANETSVERGNEIVAFSIINPTFPVRERPAFWALGFATGAVAPQ